MLTHDTPSNPPQYPPAPKPWPASSTHPGLEVRTRLVERKPQGLEWRRIGTTQWNKV